MQINNPQELKKPDEIERIVGVYRQARKDYRSIIELTQKLESDLGTIGIRFPSITRDTPMYRVANDEYYVAKQLREKAWKGLFERTGLLDRMSDERQRLMKRHITKTYELEVTEENVLNVLDMICEVWVPIQEEILLDSFSYLTRNARNRVGSRGKYATNDAYGVGQKVIVSRPGGYSESGEMDNVDKALCQLTGGTYEYSSSTAQAIEDVAKGREPNESKFFLFQVYSQTVHLKWKDEALRQRYNCEVGKLMGKGLPGEIKR